MPIDHVLKLYSESIRSPYLHYGFWDEPEKIDPKKLTSVSYTHLRAHET